jgi:hypothetical protein
LDISRKKKRTITVTDFRVEEVVNKWLPQKEEDGPER